MAASLEFILGLLDRHYPAYVAYEDLAGEHGKLLRLWQQMGFLRQEPERHPVPSCPHCRMGILYVFGARCLCGTCLSPVDRRHMLLWRFELEAFLLWLAKGLKLNGEVRQVEESLWQLGHCIQSDFLYACFFHRAGRLSELGRGRILAFRNALLIQAVPREPIEGFEGTRLSLLEVLREDSQSLSVIDLTLLMRSGNNVRFDADSGALLVGDRWLGEVPVGSKECHFLVCLAQQLDRFVPYADLKRYVLRQTGSTDTTEEATFCQKLKGRVKKRIPRIDLLLVTTNKGDGYRLRGQVATWEN
jgi:hypothetical protein